MNPRNSNRARQFFTGTLIAFALGVHIDSSMIDEMTEDDLFVLTSGDALEIAQMLKEVGNRLEDGNG